MNFDPPLQSGTLIKRYKRFLADIELDTGETITAHCPNPGALAGGTTPGIRVWVRHTPSPQRKLAYTWCIAWIENTYVGTHTGLPQTLVREALKKPVFQNILGFNHQPLVVQEEVPYAQNSRVDFLVKSGQHPPCYLEIKNVHWKRGTYACFPDSKTTRGAKHLRHLAEQVEQGFRAIVFYVVQRNDCEAFCVAHDIDPVYAHESQQAHAKGVEFFACPCDVSPYGITLLPQILPIKILGTIPLDSCTPPM